MGLPATKADYHDHLVWKTPRSCWLFLFLFSCRCSAVRSWVRVVRWPTSNPGAVAVPFLLPLLCCPGLGVCGEVAHVQPRCRCCLFVCSFFSVSVFCLLAWGVPAPAHFHQSGLSREYLSFNGFISCWIGSAIINHY